MPSAQCLSKVESYVVGIIDGSIIACRSTIQAIERHARDLARESDPDFPYRFDRDEAEQCLAFIESLEMYEGTGAGKLLKLEGFQAFIIASIFGWRRKVDNARRFKKAFLFVARGNGKTPLSAAISIISLLRDEGGQAYSVATNQAQASLVFNWVKNFVSRNAKLNEAMTQYRGAIEYKKKASVMRPLSKSFSGFDGFNPSLVVADEVAAMKNGDILSVMETALHKRPESLLVMITTSNFSSVDSPGYIEYEYSKKILSRVVEDERYFSMIYELDPYDDWRDEKTWRKANPATFVRLDELVHARDEALQSPSKEAGFRIKNLNQWLRGNRAGWVKDDAWCRAITSYKEFAEYLTPERLRGYPAAVGMDLSKRFDFSAYVIAFYVADLDRYYLLPRYYIPDGQVEEKCKKDSQQVRRWIADGSIRVTEGESINHRQIYDDFLVDAQEYPNIVRLGYDPYCSRDIIDWLAEAPIEQVAVSQKAATMSEPTKDLEELILKGKIICPSQVMRWNVNNCVLSTFNNMVKLTKEDRNSTYRIDGVICAIMAIMLLREFQRASPPVNYDFYFNTSIAI